jgi:hypothetical protein
MVEEGLRHMRRQMRRPENFYDDWRIVNLISKSSDELDQPREKVRRGIAQRVQRHWQITAQVRYEHEIAEALQTREEPEGVEGEEPGEGGRSRV